MVVLVHDWPVKYLGPLAVVGRVWLMDGTFRGVPAVEPDDEGDQVLFKICVVTRVLEAGDDDPMAVVGRKVHTVANRQGHIKG